MTLPPLTTTSAPNICASTAHDYSCKYAPGYNCWDLSSSLNFACFQDIEGSEGWLVYDAGASVLLPSNSVSLDSFSVSTSVYDGNVISQSTTPDGTTTLSKVGEDGSVREEITSPDGSKTVTEAVSGSITETVTNPDGSSSKTSTTSDGSAITVLTEPDGTIVETKTEPDGTISQAITFPDQTVISTVTNIDGSTQITSTNRVSGTSTVTSNNTDGSSVQTKSNADGSSTTTTTAPDGSTTSTATCSDGSTAASLSACTDGSSDAADGLIDDLLGGLDSAYDKYLNEAKEKAEENLSPTNRDLSLDANASRAVSNNLLDLFPQVTNCFSYTLPVNLREVSFDIVLPLCEISKYKVILEWIIYALTLFYVFNISLRTSSMFKV